MSELLFVSLVLLLDLVYFVCIVITAIELTGLFVRWVKCMIWKLRSGKNE